MAMFGFPHKKIFFLILLSSFFFASCIKKDKVTINQENVNIINSLGDDFKLYYIGKREKLLNLNVTYLDNIKDIPFNDNHKHTFIVINNLDNSIKMENYENEIMELKDKIEEYNYYFYYFGNLLKEIFSDSGLMIEKENFTPDSRSLGYTIYYGEYINFEIWNALEEEVKKGNDELFLSILSIELKRVINETL